MTPSRAVRTKVFDFDGFQIKVQFNPGRMTSTVAKVDATSIKERKCFLCAENLPPAQRGIPCDGDYLVLCNPFPIFPEHFTISCLRHTPQLIRDSFATFLRITRDLGTRYMVLYNGPRCGASAPDHLHFQAGNRSAVPMDTEYDAMKAAHATKLFASASFRAWSVEKCLRHFVTFESPDAGTLQRAFGVLYDAFQEGGPAGEEPMMNLLGFYGNGEWRIHVFPAPNIARPFTSRKATTSCSSARQPLSLAASAPPHASRTSRRSPASTSWRCTRKCVSRPKSSPTSRPASAHSSPAVVNKAS